MKLYLALSVLLHLSILLLSFSNKKLENHRNKSTGDKKVEVTLNYNKHLDIVPMVAKLSGKTKKKLDFYYGIGVWTGFNLDNTYQIDNILEGYPADRAGIKLKDRIILINGQSISYYNDLRTDSPKTLVLTIIRNGATFNITIKTDKIYYQ